MVAVESAAMALGQVQRKTEEEGEGEEKLVRSLETADRLCMALAEEELGVM